MSINQLISAREREEAEGSRGGSRGGYDILIVVDEHKSIPPRLEVSFPLATHETHTNTQRTVYGIP